MFTNHPLSLDDYWFDGSFRRRKMENSKTSTSYIKRACVAGDFNAAQTKEWIKKYFGAIKAAIEEKLRRGTNTETIKANLRTQTFKSQWLLRHTELLQ
jgi:hypothetical protein